MRNRSQKQSVKADGTNSKDKMTSNEENKQEAISTAKSFTEREDKVGQDGKRNRVE
jgi:hypothetical protein